jgi:hypothetical protein
MIDLYASFDVNTDLPTLSGAATGTFFSGGSPGAGGISQVYDTYPAGTPAPVGPSGAIGAPLLHDIGRGRRLLFNSQIVVTYLAAGGASTMQVAFVGDDDANGTNRNSIPMTSAVAKASLVQGFRYPLGHTPGRVYNSANLPARYVYASYIIATFPPTQGKISTWLSLDIDDHAEVFGTV